MQGRLSSRSVRLSLKAISVFSHIKKCIFFFLIISINWEMERRSRCLWVFVTSSRLFRSDCQQSGQTNELISLRLKAGAQKSIKRLWSGRNCKLQIWEEVFVSCLGINSVSTWEEALARRTSEYKAGNCVHCVFGFVLFFLMDFLSLIQTSVFLSHTQGTGEKAVCIKGSYKSRRLGGIYTTRGILMFLI